MYHLFFVQTLLLIYYIVSYPVTLHIPATFSGMLSRVDGHSFCLPSNIAPWYFLKPSGFFPGEEKEKRAGEEKEKRRKRKEIPKI
jgi:hypothetical protein